MAALPTIKIDVVSDLACPWCAFKWLKTASACRPQQSKLISPEMDRLGLPCIGPACSKRGCRIILTAMCGLTAVEGCLQVLCWQTAVGQSDAGICQPGILSAAVVSCWALRLPRCFCQHISTPLEQPAKLCRIGQGQALTDRWPGCG